jgi:tRNA A-37 threonylcarbamoyl transferase component Bud32
VDDAVTHSHAPFAGRYTIEREIGRGGMATVYRARDLRHDRVVALKVLHPELAASMGGERFAREIRLLAGLHHPHILPLFDSGEHEGAVFYVVPCVEGESLRRRLERERQLPLEDAMRITREVADALDHAHRHGVIHRDIKPENVLLEEGHAIVADFGVARAVTRAVGESHTTAGMVVGTPAYMSPEQASGDDELDARSDQYSLACVLYEMLAGAPPFSGTTPRATIARRFTEPAPSLHGERDVPEALDRAIRRALSAVPADRFPDVRAFSKALDVADAPARPPSQAVATLGIPAVAAIALALVIWWPKGGGADSIDPGLHAVLPFAVEGSSASGNLDGGAVARHLGRAMGFWRDMRLVDALRATDAVDRHGALRTLSDALAIARALGAGRLLWGDIWNRGDSIEVRATLYDVRSEREERTARVMMGAEVTNIGPAFEALSDSLALGSLRERAAKPAARGTRVRQAFVQYEAGHHALGTWDLVTAERAFRGASELDPEFAQAALMLAQVLAWTGAKPAEWRVPAAQAVLRREQLGPRERALADGLLALAEERFPQACDQYRAMVRRDSLDFVAWYGLGDCQAKDPLVERDARSPSGWRFRGSWYSGIQAYARAMKLVPSFHRAQRSASPLPTDLFPVEPLVFRRGYALTPDTVRFVAEPGFEGDTLSLVPRPPAEVVDTPGGVSTESNAAALAWSRQQLREVAEAWVQAFPTSPLAHEALGAAFEAAGDVPEAARAAHAARTFAADRPARVRLAADNVRLLVKNAQWERARHLADSTLALVGESASVDEAWYLSGLAALVGQVAHAREFLEIRGDDSTSTFFSRGRPVVVPRRLARAALAALAYASFPASRDSLAVLMRRVDEIVDASIQSGRRDEVRRVVLSLPMTFGFWQLEPSSALRIQSPTALHRMQRAFARGDTKAVRAVADSAHARRESQQTSSSLIDFVYHESLVLLAIGDTTTATRRLDQALEGLANASQMLLSDVHRAAAIPAAMLLRARLAARAGDRALARRWALGALALWQGADGEIQRLLDEVRPLAGNTR